MATKYAVKRDTYFDSLRLMSASVEVGSLPGVTQAVAIMGTEANLTTLKQNGFDFDNLPTTSPADVLLAVRGTSEEEISLALTHFVAILGPKRLSDAGELKADSPRSLKSAINTLKGANLALISVPGEYAAGEAFRALNANLHVMIFSDNVTLTDELALKQLAKEKGLLVMGPDCGTAIIHNTPLCFANAVARGPIGIVGASGTGIQEATVLIDHLGSGISHAIGTGGRDLSDDIGGITALASIDLLEQDPGTSVLLLVSKPPGKETSKTLLARLRRCAKPVVLALLGESPLNEEANGIYTAPTIEAAVVLAVAIAKGDALGEIVYPFPPHQLQKAAEAEALGARNGQVHLRGLFSGGTLAEEAKIVLTPLLGRVFSNTAKSQELKPRDLLRGHDHYIIDLGDDEFTRGRPHPMIDPSYRAARLELEYQDLSVAVILCDIVLGYGAHSNPALALAHAVKKARSQAQHFIPVICSVCGTTKDPQNRAEQVLILQEAGIIVAPSNASAALLAGTIANICAQRGQD